MASENLNVGTAANANDGDTLRAAFIKVKKMFADIYGQTYSEQDDLSGETFSISTSQMEDNAITHAKLENRYTEKTTSSSTGSQNLDASAASTFLLTGNITTATLTIQNLKVGQTIDILLSGTLTSAVITLDTDFTTDTISRVGTTELDTSKTNLIQVTCLDDTDSAAKIVYSINEYATDTTP